MKKIDEILSNGESSFVEFKDERVHTESLAKEMAAFANTEGGAIYIGVADDGTIKGITRQDVEEWVFNIARDKVKPALLPLFETIQYKKKKIAKISIHKDTSGPFSASGKYYIRAGSTSREYSKEELARLFQHSRQVFFEETPIYHADESHFEKDTIKDYFKDIYDYDITDFDQPAYKALLQNTGLLTDEGHATVVGLVMFGKRNSGNIPPAHYTQKYLPQSGVVYAHYNGFEINDELLDNTRFEGTAPDLVEKLVEKVLLRLATPSKIVGLKREEKTPLPRKVLREALVNAVCHRDYSLRGKIRVFQFEDRLEVISPGRLPNSVTVEKMKVSYAIHRNPLIVKFMENLRYIDGLGRGVPMIFREMRNLGAKIPQILADESQVRLVIYFTPTAF
ncbi:MAG: RNA-binding domain-containing protein [bacterium]